ncbi:MAG: hypothetical protein Q9195_008953 [Heterodermia aff. obscurata]
MSTGSKVPDAWDDDWTTTVTPEPAPTSKKLSKAERRAKQAEFNRQLWADADNTRDSYYVNTRDEVPFKTEFKPAMKVLSRKPITKITNASDPASGIGQLSLEDEDEDDDADQKKNVMTVQERQQKAQRDREEKQRKYEEVRERLFGTEAAEVKKNSGITTPPKQRPDADSRRQSRSRGGGEGRPSSSAGSKSRQLFDPMYTAKTDSTYIQKRDGQTDSGRSTPSEQLPIRNPKGPDGSGRGGFGFASRGGRIT